MQVPLYQHVPDSFIIGFFPPDIDKSKYFTSQVDYEGYFGLFGNPFKRVFKRKDDQDKNYYYPFVVGFSSVSEISERFIIPSTVLHDIRQGNAKILMVCPYEGWAWSVWELIINPVKNRYNLKFEDFVVLDGNLKTHSRIKSVYFNFWERNLLYKNLPDLALKGYDSLTNNRDYEYIFLNRRPHAGRIAAVTLMRPYKDRGLLSLGVSGKMHKGYYERQEQIFQNVYNKIYSTYENINLISELPLKINDGIDAEQENPVDDRSPEKFYNSYLHIVAETYQTSMPGRMFFSEKVFKPIIYMQPFVVLGQAGSLEYLRSLGYETFSPYLDESYDIVESDQKRLIAAIKSVKLFLEKNEDEKKKMLTSMTGVLLHNISNLQSRCMKYDNQIRLKLLEILDDK